MSQSILLSISGQDRAGIVRDVSEVLLKVQVNIEDSSMTVLRGQFTMMLIVGLDDGVDAASFQAHLTALERRTGLSVQPQVLTDEQAAHIPDEPDCVITVSGADKAGIVFAVSAAMAELGVSVVDVSTRSRGGVYMMALEVVAGADVSALQKAMAVVSQAQLVAIEVHHLDDDVM